MVKRYDALETTTTNRFYLTGSQNEILRYQILNLVQAMTQNADFVT